jgi:hypothetical protein
MPGTIRTLAGPLALTNTYTTNVFNDTNTNVFNVVRHIHIANKTSAAVTFRLYMGTTGANTAGTELFYDKSVPAFDYLDWYGLLRMASTDFLVGGASASTSLTITIMGERIPV